MSQLSGFGLEGQENKMCLEKSFKWEQKSERVWSEHEESDRSAKMWSIIIPNLVKQFKFFELSP